MQPFCSSDNCLTHVVRLSVSWDIKVQVSNDDNNCNNNDENNNKLCFGLFCVKKNC